MLSNIFGEIKLLVEKLMTTDDSELEKLRGLSAGRGIFVNRKRRFIIFVNRKWDLLSS